MICLSKIGYYTEVWSSDHTSGFMLLPKPYYQKIRNIDHFNTTGAEKYKECILVS